MNNGAYQEHIAHKLSTAMQNSNREFMSCGTYVGYWNSFPDDEKRRNSLFYTKLRNFQENLKNAVEFP